MSLTTEPAAPESFNLKVIVRHSADCPQKDKGQDFRKCNCRKSVYQYESGKVSYISAKTRSWTKTETFMRTLLDARDPVKKALRDIEERERVKAAAEEAAKAANIISVAKAVNQWLAGEPVKSRSQRVQFESFAAKLISWSAEQGIEWLHDIRPAMMYEWRGQWSVDAEVKRDRLAPPTQNIYVSHMHRFFKWAVNAEYLDKDPSRLVKRGKVDHNQTQPLSGMDQFNQLLQATFKLDDDRYTLRPTPEYGRDLRAIFELQRWTGIRLIDALMLKRSAVKDGRMTLKTKKTGAWITDRKLPQRVLDALAEIPDDQERVRDGYYFWSAGCENADNLTIIWTQRINKFNDYLDLRDEDGKPMAFRSHMLRDTFAVELLIAGMPIEDVSKLLTHRSIRETERSYAPWVRRREDKLAAAVEKALAEMGAGFSA
jgi:integrase/recombinase XerD